MNPHQITAELRIAGTSSAKLAKMLQVSPAIISMVINGKAQSRRVKNAISIIINRPIDEIWPPKEKADQARSA